MSKKDMERTTEIDVLHAESLALGSANREHIRAMLGLCVFGFGGLAGLASLLWKDHQIEALYVAPLVILILWMCCIRILAEVVMTSEYQRYFDHRLSELLEDGRVRSWQDSARPRGQRSLAQRTIYSFLAVVSLFAIVWCGWQSINLDGWILVDAIWAGGILLIGFSAWGLRGLRERVRADLETGKVP